MLKIRARSSRDDQVESELLPTAGGIGPDGTVGISSPSTVATTGISRCKGVDRKEVIRCRRRRVGAAATTATFDVFERMKACEREGTLCHADRSSNDVDRVRHGFGSGNLRGARQEIAEGTQIGGRTTEYISSATLHGAHPLRKKSAQSPCGSH